MKRDGRWIISSVLAVIWFALWMWSILGCSSLRVVEVPPGTPGAVERWDEDANTNGWVIFK